MDPLIGTTIHFLPSQSRQPDEAPRGGLGSQVLPVAELDDDFEGEPEDGMQYLFLVRREAQLHPRVNRAKDYPDPSQMIYSKEATEGGRVGKSDGRKRRPKPSEAWRMDFLEKFGELRSRLAIPPTYKPGYQGHAILPPIPSSSSDPSEPSPWILFIQGLELPPSSSAPQDPPLPPPPLATPSDADPLHEPTLAELKAQTLASLGISPPSSPTLTPSQPPTTTSYHPAYPPHSPTPILLSKIKRGGILKILQLLSEECFPFSDEREKEGGGLMPSRHTLEWVLGLLSILSEVLNGDDLSCLRGVTRELREYAEEESAAAGSEEKEERRAMCWMAVAAVAGIWRQEDLWDESLV